MKAVLVGAWRWDIYEKALSDGFQKHGVAVIPFSTTKYLSHSKLNNLLLFLKIGKAISRINHDLFKLIINEKPDFIFFDKPTFIKSETLKKIKKYIPKIKFITNHNDNPFIHKYKNIRHRLYLSILKHCDLNYVYRPSNILQAKKYGSKKTKVLYPFYVVGKHDIDVEVKKENDVIFIGHFEKDDRADFCEFLLQNNINLKIIGAFWDKARKYPLLSKVKIQKEVLGNQYVKTIKSARIALVFLSKYNKDVYTRRCFEIPVTGTFMLAPKTNELQEIYEENMHCGYYINKADLLKKINFYLENSLLREKIASKGKEKCVYEQHNNYGRTLQILDDIKKLI